MPVWTGYDHDKALCNLERIGYHCRGADGRDARLGKEICECQWGGY